MSFSDANVCIFYKHAHPISSDYKIDCHEANATYYTGFYASSPQKTMLYISTYITEQQITTDLAFFLWNFSYFISLLFCYALFVLDPVSSKLTISFLL